MPNSRRSSLPINENTIFESFMEFLRSDLWLIPIGEFVEQRSIVFDRDPNLDGGMPINNETHQKMHNEFKKMVLDLLDAHCRDADITRDQLMGALKARDQAQKLSQKDKLLLEPIVAAQDFDVFVPMMMRKNIELQLQALKMIEHLNGLLPSSLKLGQEDAQMWNELFEEEESDRYILISVLKQSREEWERDQRTREHWSAAQMEDALRESLREKTSLEEARQREQRLLEQALNKVDISFMKLSLNSADADQSTVEKNEKSESIEKSVKFDVEHNMFISPTPSTSRTYVVERTESNIITLDESRDASKKQRSASTTRSPPKNKEEEEKKQKQKLKGTEKKRLSLGQVHAPLRRTDEARKGTSKGELAYRALLKERDDISEGQLRDRAQYLREQRNKLLQKKSREREKQLIEAAKRIDETRPQTAKAARDVMEESKNEVEEQRRRIAAKIKAEVLTVPQDN